MHSSNVNFSQTYTLNHIQALQSPEHPPEHRRVIVAEELNRLTPLESLPNQILIQGDVIISFSNIHAFLLLSSKDVKIEGSLIYETECLSDFLDKKERDSQEKIPSFLPKKLEIKGDLKLMDCKTLIALPEELKVMGSLHLSNCKALTHLPSGLEVRKDLNLSHCIALSALGKGLKVGGSFDLLVCPALTHLPDDIEVGHNLTFYDSTGLKMLPSQLKVRGSLTLYNCIALTDLSSDLRVEKDIDLSNCKALTVLPSELKVRGSLNLSGTAITTLPLGLEVEKDLYLSNCKALTALPRELKVGGSLDLSGTALTTLPLGLAVEKDLYLSNCKALTALPSELKVGGSLDLSGTPLTMLPERLEVRKDLNLSYCKALTALPSEFKVGGSLNLSDTALMHLSEGLEVGKDLNLSHCTKLRVLSNRLKVGGSLILYNCVALTHLPSDLRVKQDLILSNCIALTILPKELKVGGCLDLSHCTALTLFPEGLEVEKNLYLSHCTALTALPSQLKVGGSLNLSGAPLIIFPEGIEVRKDLNLSRCTALTGLPTQLSLGGHLNLSQCSSLTALPNWIATLGCCSDGRTRMVNLTESGLSFAVITRLQEMARHIVGIQFHFSREAAKAYMTEFKALLPALQFWQTHTEQESSLNLEELCHQLHQMPIGVKDHQNLLAFLQRLTATADFQNKVTRIHLAKRLLQLIQLMAEDAQMYAHAAFLIHQGLSSCDDRVMATLDDIALYQKLHNLQQDSVTAEELKTAARGLFLLEELNKKITLYTRKLHFVDEVEVTMAFHIRLQEMLKLPLETKEMLFRGCVSISDEEIDRVGGLVLQEMTQSSFEAFLAVWNPWNRYQRRLLVSPWENLPIIDQKASLTDICPYLQDTPEQPVLYNNVVYDYAPFIRRYIEEGVDLTREKVHMDKLFRMEFSELSPS